MISKLLTPAVKAALVALIVALAAAVVDILTGIIGVL